jgi:hypothetical protein
MKQRRQTKAVLTVYCNAGHESTVMVSVISNGLLKERTIDLWCPVCNRTGVLEINSARIITNYE